MTERLPERRPARLLPFDFHHEKVALTRMAQWLQEQGWQAQLSVHPDRATAEGDLGGEDPMQMDEAFQQRFNDEGNWRYRYTFYYDHPGRFDLVARKDGVVLIIDGKGRSATNRRGAVAQMIGNLALARDPSRPNRRYAILLPEGAAWDKALRNYGGLDWLEVFRIGSEPPGDIRVDSWSSHPSDATEK